ncbi:MAG: hypothetical protein U9R53_07200 [Chloroflexota bacterium]|nr:hypothetical protein [Chloroflexota bacterium]
MKNKNPDPHKKSPDKQYAQYQVCQFIPGKSLQPGMTCPRCHNGTIEYDGLLHLVCPNCGLTEAGACT